MEIDDMFDDDEDRDISLSLAGKVEKQEPVSFKREDRYLVVKRDDIARYLTERQQMRLKTYMAEIAMRRIEDGKTNHGYVVVSDGYPEIVR